MESLKKSNEFKKVYKHRRSVAGRLLVLYTLRNGLKKNRLGISVSKKVGQAVFRNRVKRLIKESLRQNPPSLLQGYDFVVVVRQAFTNDVTYMEVSKNLLNLFKKQKLLQDDTKEGKH